MQTSFLHAKNGCMLSIDFVKISNSIYRQVNISESGSISRFIDSVILGVWPIALRLFIVHVIIVYILYKELRLTDIINIYTKMLNHTVQYHVLKKNPYEIHTPKLNDIMCVNRLTLIKQTSPVKVVLLSWLG